MSTGKGHYVHNSWLYLLHLHSVCVLTFTANQALLLLLLRVQVGLPSLRLRLQPFFRPEDISRELAYTAGLWDLYAPAAAADADADAVSDVESVASEAGSSSSSSSSVLSGDLWMDASMVVGKCAVKAAGAPLPAGESSVTAIQLQT
jgi:hypothetical protein